MRIGRRAWRAVVSLLVAVSLAGSTGCEKPAEEGGGGGGATPGGSGGNAGGGGEAGGGRRIVIGVVAKSRGNDVFQAALAGARDAARHLGPKYGADVEISWQTPEQEDASKQAEFVESLTRKGAAGIAISCSNADTVTPAIDEAVEKGIPVMCFDSDAPDSRRFCYYGTDDLTCGRKVMEELARAMGEKGTVAILAGSEAAPNLRRRTEGVREGLKKYPGMKEVGVYYHVETPADAAQKVQDVQRTSATPIEGWAFIGGWPLFTEEALPWSPGKVKVVSVDALPKQLDYLRSGHVEVLLGQDCYGWGYRSVEILLEKIVNKKDPPEAKLIDPLTRVTKDNADEYGKNWEKWLKK
jgi:ribose transport system substrate-binding protein